MGAKPNGRRTPGTFMGRLAANAKGNTLAMMAIALVPLSALAGSAIDTSRLYFVKVRLQQACDAGALAGRKFMTGTTYPASANTQAQAFFTNNFKSDTYGSTAVSATFTKTAENQIAGSATATVPMTIMKMFGAQASVLTVTCEAKLEVPNLDIMFVLDTTGSMGETNPSDSVSRISAMRTAVVNFYDTLEAAKTASSQVRYGFVPYSSTVNVGLLLKRDWMVDTSTYQSRQPADITMKTSTSTGGPYLTTYGPWTYISGAKDTYTTNGDPENCSAPANTLTYPSTSTPWTSNGNGSESRTTTQTLNGSTYSTSLSNGVCTITETSYKNYKQSQVETRTPNPDAGKSTTTTSPVYWWNYQPVSYQVSVLKGSAANGLMAGGTIKAKINGGGSAEWSDRSINWNSGNACIEERQTVRQSDYSTIPSAALDLDIDSEPDRGRPETQWKPWISNLVYARSYGNYDNGPTVNTGSWPTDVITPIRFSGGYMNLSSRSNDSAACPSAARKLATMTKGNLVSYMNGLKVAGRTYHDIGFLWGLRLLSSTGLFKSENTTAPNGGQIVRNIIFMTDGQTETNFSDYDAYGLAAIDRRRTDASRLPLGDGETDTIVDNRLTALCRAARARDTTVWVIAFGTTLTPLLKGCAKSDAHAFQADDAATLNSAFAAIAANIAKLRISK